MSSSPRNKSLPRLSLKRGIPYSLGAIAAFHLANIPIAAWMIAAFPILLLPLIRLASTRLCFYTGFGLGFALYVPQLGFFWSIFGPAAVVLWGVLAFWLGFFLAVGHVLWTRFLGQRELPLARRLPPWTGPISLVVLLSIVWTGCEYFRSELYYLRFSWLTPGFALAGANFTGPFRTLGVYGIGTVLFLGSALIWFTTAPWRWAGLLVVASPFIAPRWTVISKSEGLLLKVAGAQVEGILEDQLPAILDRLLTQHRDAELIVLPEYTLDNEPDATLRAWCQRNRRHLIVGGKECPGESRFRNTAWVVDPNGEIVFRQVKSVPIQFFSDGLPAETQTLWDSPWGGIGIAICYDLSYARVVDPLVRMGAVVLVVPTMDLFSWGAQQHALHARVAPVRAAEYGIPVIRCASSGISQIVDVRGEATASAPFSEDVHFFAGAVRLCGPGTLPLDRWLGPLASALTGCVIAFLSWHAWRSNHCGFGFRKILGDPGPAAVRLPFSG